MRSRITRVVVGLAVSSALIVPTVATSAVGASSLPTPPAEENVNLPPGLTPYHEIAPALADIAERSKRVEVEVIGQSAEGRDIYLVTVAAPEARRNFGKYRVLRNLMLRDPELAQERAADFEDFVVPVYVAGSIHGNEWEGVDATLELIERLAFDDDPRTMEVLENTVTLFNVVANPDGRVHGTRANGNGFDLNRDLITASQPETHATLDVITEWNPMVMLDLHGYVGGYLLEPTTPPHNPNYEYDLYIDWALGQAHAMADALVAKDHLGTDPVIPAEDWDPGDWDDWPPIFTPMYAMYHGAYGHTLETHLGQSPGLPPEERERRAEINTEAHATTVWAALEYVSENRLEMVLDQMEIFRRGFIGTDPAEFPDDRIYGDQGKFTWPEGYVIPMGDGQGSDAAAVNLVNHLLLNDVRVERLNRPLAVDGTTYPAGSYVVDMQQPKRGLANTILEDGWDISELVPQMYDISGWSHGLLWGADVVRVDAGLPFNPRSAPVRGEQQASGTMPRGQVAAYGFDLTDAAAVQAVNTLLDDGVSLARTDDGRIVASSSAERAVRSEVAGRGVDVVALDGVPADAVELSPVDIGCACSSDEFYTLTTLGFDVTPVSTSLLNDGQSLDDIDVLWVSSGLVYGDLTDAARARVDDYLDGGGVIGGGTTGAEFSSASGSLTVGVESGPFRANGIVEVHRTEGAPTTGAYPADGHSFVYAPVWFTDVPPEATVDERLGTGDFFVSGHWIGHDAAASGATVVSGTGDVDAKVVLFGTRPLFRDHPKGLYPQVANAVFWSAAE
ncbi:M14 family zinc carboxypeptidase [Phytoactinopolyspora halotolerans]|uniref:Peptidase M28 n=1 Tax=Phytoactinopolyspora halotolerans TaxID=1981512 RepID=A0A6L9SJF7_9ACTN|nr:M14 family zinc carboxypeptidase [Phytoactinopolyspora halotolerans]NEE04210.1 peptidase M28 [Phytoactinopolyspora halotolerans]